MKTLNNQLRMHGKDAHSLANASQGEALSGDVLDAIGGGIGFVKIVIVIDF